MNTNEIRKQTMNEYNGECHLMAWNDNGCGFSSVPLVRELMRGRDGDSWRVVVASNGMEFRTSSGALYAHNDDVRFKTPGDAFNYLLSLPTVLYDNCVPRQCNLAS